MSKKSDKKQRILRAAREVFSKFGFHQTKVEEIAKKAGVAKGTIYLYFDSKRELFFESLRTTFKEFFDETEERIKDLPNPLDKIKAVTYGFFEYLEKNKRFIRILTQEPIHSAGKRSDLYRERFLEVYKEINEKIAGLMQQAISEGYFKEIDPFLLASFFSGMISRSSVNLLLFEPTREFTELAPSLLEVFFNGALKHRR